MPAHVATVPGRSYNQERSISPARLALAVAAIASVAIAVYIAESYPKRVVHTLPRTYQAQLPYDLYALEPSISAETMDFHYNKHDYGYDKKLQGLVNKTKYEKMSLVEILHANENEQLPDGIYNNAGQLMNHNLFWASMTPDLNDRSAMSAKLLKQIQTDFKTVDLFVKEFTTKAVNHFGSGWVWVLFNKKSGKIEISTTPNGNYPSPVADYIPLFNCDVWEHSYYIDYRNRRDEFIKNFQQVINWKFASDNFELA